MLLNFMEVYFIVYQDMNVCTRCITIFEAHQYLSTQKEKSELAINDIKAINVSFSYMKLNTIP